MRSLKSSLTWTPSLTRTLSLSLALVLLLGCQQARIAPLTEQLIDDLGDLPRVAESADAELREEIVRLREQHATPRQVESPAIADDVNVAAALIHLFHRKDLPKIAERVDALMPRPEFRLDDSYKIERMILVRSAYESQRRAVRKALERPQCNFGVRHSHGWFFESDFLQIVAIAAGLEACYAAEHLANDRVDDAVTSVETMLALANHLSWEKHVSSRVLAAQIRGDALNVMGGLVGHSQAQPQHAERLLGFVQAQLDNWPADSRAWVGDRAIALHFYEVTRAGHLVSMLSAVELSAFVRDKKIRQLKHASSSELDADQRFYLDAMHQVIASCSEGSPAAKSVPYFRRQQVFTDIEQELTNRTDTASYPMIAGQILLTDLRRSQQVFVRDRARTEAWALALAASLGKPLKRYEINPGTGKPYDVRLMRRLVAVRGVATGIEDLDAPVMVPRFDLRISQRPPPKLRNEPPR